jgi:adenylosuccinate lyase
VEGGDFRAKLEADPAITSHLNAAQLAECFSTELHQAQLDTIYGRLGI